jgi:hypothetical protein
MLLRDARLDKHAWLSRRQSKDPDLQVEQLLLRRGWQGLDPVDGLLQPEVARKSVSRPGGGSTTLRNCVRHSGQADMSLALRLSLTNTFLG